MRTRFAINGFGRIGRALLRIAHRRDDLELVAINDLVPPRELAHLLARDTVHGPFSGTVAAAEGALVVDGRRIPVHAAATPAEVPWEASEPMVVVEATGRFLERRAAAGHLRGPVRRVVLTANSEQADVTLCLGVNGGDYDPARHRVVSNASCTTNCLAPLLRVLDSEAGVEQAFMTTVHAYTGNQRLVDLAHPDPRRSRAAASNIIPVGTSAAAATGRVLPAMAGRVQGMTVRVPIPEGAMLDLIARLGTETSAEELRQAFRRAASADLAGILAVTEDELVSSDFIGSPCSAVVDLPLIQLAEDRRLCRVVAWFDNEWGYASRLAELLALLGEAER